MNRVKGTIGLICVSICLMLLLQAPHACAGPIELTVPDTCASTGESLWLPIYTSDVTDSGVYAYNLIVKFDSMFIEIDSVTSDGTLSAMWGGGALIWNVVEGQDSLRIADFGIMPLTGEGILVRIQVHILPTAPIDTSTEVSIPSAAMRDDPEKPAPVTHPGDIVIPCTAGIEVEVEEPERLELNRLGPAKVRWALDSGGMEPGKLRIYDPRGRRVAAIEPDIDGSAATYVWDGRTGSGNRASGGVYFYKLTARSRLWTGKVQILR